MTASSDAGQHVSGAGAVASATAPASPGVPSRAVDASRLARRRARRRHERLVDLAMVGPALVLVLAFFVAPIFIAVYLSLTDYTGFTAPKFVGGANYAQIFTDTALIHAAVVTVIIVIVGTIVGQAAGLGAALLVNGTGRLNAVARGVFFYPYIVGAVIIGFLWQAILGTNGAINGLMEHFGSVNVPFLAQPIWAISTVTFIIIWSGFGFSMVLFLAGLQTLPNHVIEAAVIDGANSWQLFWKVKLPLLAPVVTINLLLSMIGLLRTYELVLAVTAGGPAGATQTIVYEILQVSFFDQKLGYGTAQSVLLMIVVILASLVLLQIRRRAERDAAA